jgi:hypothetical protein
MVDCKIYPLNPSEQKQLDEFLKEQLETGRIQPSKSPMVSPFFFIKKKDGTLRLGFQSPVKSGHFVFFGMTMTVTGS